MNIRRFAPIAFVPLLLIGCGKKAEDKTQVKSADTTSISVVVKPVTAGAYDEWISHPGELRGLDDAVLITSAAGRVNSIAQIGKSVKAGEALCDIESDRYKAQYDAAVAAAELAKGEVERAKANVDAGSLGKSALQGATAQYLGARTQMLGAQKMYDESRCLAPFSGVVASRMAERWAVVGPGSPTVRVVRSDRFEAIIPVPEAEGRALKAGALARFRLSDGGREVIEGKVLSVDLAVEPRHRTIAVRLELPNKGGLLRSGLIGRGEILAKRWNDAVRVPSTALLRKESGVTAMIERKGIAREVPVQLGTAEGDSVLVREGLSAGDQLIVEGAFRVSDGSRLKF